MSMPVTAAPLRAAGIARLPVPQATSSTRVPGPIGSRSTNSSAHRAVKRAIWPKSPAIQVARKRLFSSANSVVGCMSPPLSNSLPDQAGGTGTAGGPPFPLRFDRELRYPRHVGAEGERVMLNDLYFRVRSLLRRRSVEGELDDELRF